MTSDKTHWHGGEGDRQCGDQSPLGKIDDSSKTMAHERRANSHHCRRLLSPSTISPPSNPPILGSIIGRRLAHGVGVYQRLPF
eukprot:14180316-Heterocapsa_arctica.AAC.1